MNYGDASCHRRLRRARLLAVTALLGLLLVIACHDNAPPAWPWWTDADRTAANNELTAWRDSITTRFFVENAAQAFVDSAGVIGRDSTSPTGDSLIKVRRLLGFGLVAADTARRDSLLFGVTVDSVTSDTTPGDTFCHVIATDSSTNGFSVVDYDQYWVVKYHRVVEVDTTVSPPETTVTYRVDDSVPPPRLVSAPQSAQKEAPWRTERYLYLRKLQDAYHLRRMSGFSLFMPATSSAPNIRSLTLTYQGQPDTFKLSAQNKGNGIYNLRDRDSLYAVEHGQPLYINVRTDKPVIKGDIFYYFAVAGAERRLLGKDSTGINGEVRFPDIGLRHLTIEVIPQSNLFYPGSAYSAAIWSLPIRVK